MSKSSHGMTDTKVYRAWCNIKSRCGSPQHKSYPHYGGRGIRVCPEWIASFEKFFAHVGLPPSNNHTIDRIDNDRGYEPGNVRWATNSEQKRNTTRNRVITFRGRSMLLVEWANELGMSRCALHKRLQHWPLERALTEEVGAYFTGSLG